MRGIFPPLRLSAEQRAQEFLEVAALLTGRNPLPNSITGSQSIAVHTNPPNSQTAVTIPLNQAINCFRINRLRMSQNSQKSSQVYDFA